MFFLINTNGECRMVADLRTLNLPMPDLDKAEQDTCPINYVGVKDNLVYIYGKYFNELQVSVAIDYLHHHWHEFLP